MSIYYKATKPDGTDFYTGRVNYRDAIGWVLSMEDVPLSDNHTPPICSQYYLHASEKPIDTLTYTKGIDVALFQVEGAPIVRQSDKAGFRELEVIQEITDLDKAFGFRHSEALNPVHPFRLDKQFSPSKRDLGLLREWASVRASVVWESVGDSVGDSVRASVVWASVGDSVRDSVGASVWDSVWDSVRPSVWDSVGASVWDSVRASVGASVGASVWDSVWDSVGASVRDSVWDSVKDSVWAYIGSLFPDAFPKPYPYNSAATLWRHNLVPSFDGTKWRLHTGPNAEIIWEGTL